MKIIFQLAVTLMIQDVNEKTLYSPNFGSNWEDPNFNQSI
jgi:hypothetical protein